MDIYKYVTSDKFNQFFQNIVHIPQYRDDLKHFVIEILLSKPDKYNDAIKSKFIDYITVRIICNQWRSVTSPFYKQYRSYDVDMPSEKAKKIKQSQELEYSTNSIEDLESLDHSENELRLLLLELPPHYQVILGQWYGLLDYEKKSTREIATLAQMPHSTIYQHLLQAKKMLTEKVLNSNIQWKY